MLVIGGRKNMKRKAVKIRSNQNYINDDSYKNMGMYTMMFYEDFCRAFSIDLNLKENGNSFYKIDSKNQKLIQLLEQDDYMFLSDNLDKLLADNISDLLLYGNANIEVIKIFDKENKLVKLFFKPFGSVFNLNIGNYEYCFFKMSIKKINKNDVICFKLKYFGYGRYYFKRIFKKLNKIDPLLEFDNNNLTEETINKIDFSLLKIGHKLGWNGRKNSNKYLSEPYMLYLRIQFLKNKEKWLKILLKKYNKKLISLGEKYGFTGEIEYKQIATNLDDLYEQFEQGIIDTKQFYEKMY